MYWIGLDWVSRLSCMILVLSFFLSFFVEIWDMGLSRDMIWMDMGLMIDVQMGLDFVRLFLLWMCYCTGVM
jgi:hypothetical protein